MSWRGISSDERDPYLTQNRGYFVDQDELAAHLEAHKGQPQEVSNKYPDLTTLLHITANMDSGVRVFPITL